MLNMIVFVKSHVNLGCRCDNSQSSGMHYSVLSTQVQQIRGTFWYVTPCTSFLIIKPTRCTNFSNIFLD